MLPKITSPVSAVLLALLLVGSACCNVSKYSEGEQVVAPRTIEEVLTANTPQLMAIAGVVGTAQGEHQGKPCIRIFVVAKSAEFLKRLPSELEGYPVVIQQTGAIEAR